MTGVLLSGSAETIQNRDITTKISVVFNTLCAKCHEGECSGRLSFETGSHTAARHIRHYAGDTNLTAKEVREFFSLLNYMKEECAVYMPDDGEWKPENLSRFALPSNRGYFIPLGTLKSGRYHLAMVLQEATPFRIEVMTEKIETLLDHSITTLQKNHVVDFTVDESTAVFVRIRSREVLHLIALEIKPDNMDGKTKSGNEILKPEGKSGARRPRKKRGS